MVERFAGQRAATPERVAVVDGDESWTYDELDRAAGTVARMLAGAGLGSGATIGVCLPRSKEAIGAMLGIWMAGATYLPLDPDHPPARLAALCRRADVRLVIGRPAALVDAEPSLRYADASLVAPTPRGRRGRAGPPRGPVPEALAYVLFTSGSSGRPKGVEVTHRSLASVLDWLRDTLGPEELAVTTTSVSFSFDPFVIEVLGPLTTGGRVHVIPTALAVGDAETGATLLANTPSVLGELLRAGRLPTSLRTVVVGGEVLSTALAHELLVGAGVPRLVNTYGPTEATVLADRRGRDAPHRQPGVHRPRAPRCPRRPARRRPPPGGTGRAGRDLPPRSPGGRGLPRRPRRDRRPVRALARRPGATGADLPDRRPRTVRSGRAPLLLRTGGPAAEGARLPDRAGGGGGGAAVPSRGRSGRGDEHRGR